MRTSGYCRKRIDSTVKHQLYPHYRQHNMNKWVNGSNWSCHNSCVTFQFSRPSCENSNNFGNTISWGIQWAFHVIQEEEIRSKNSQKQKSLRQKTAHDTREGRKWTRKQHSLLVSALKYTDTQTHALTSVTMAHSAVSCAALNSVLTNR